VSNDRILQNYVPLTQENSEPIRIKIKLDTTLDPNYDTAL
jgi:hypothetical protein